MTSRLVLQSPQNPTEILTSLEALAGPATSELRIAVAYATLTGCTELLPRLADRVGEARWAAIPKAAIVSTDFHITEPAALVDLQAHGFAVRLANTPGSSFHPKLYVFASDEGLDALVGSANLTRAALTVNTEAAIASRLSDDFEPSWRDLSAGSVDLTEEILHRYTSQRKTRPPTVFPDPIPAPPPSATVGTAFPDVVRSGVLDPSTFNSLWIEAGSMSSSGSHAQLELPRGANRFFGFGFEEYDEAHHVIGTPLLFSGGKSWADRPLTWHGNNRMERLNLPTSEQGGFSYRDTAIMFRRRGTRFQLTVAAWSSPTAVAWRVASAKISRVYKLGQNSPRICGLF